jgi:hypothetical protein
MSWTNRAAWAAQETAEAALTLWESAGLPDAHLTRQVLYMYGTPDLGVVVEPGSFRRCLIDAAARADTENRLRLSLGFPELIATVNAIEYVPDGSDRLVALLEVEANKP